MKKLWNIVSRFNINNNKKSALYIISLTLLSIIIGACIWLLVGRFFLPELAGLFCFMGYPALFIGLFGGTVYLYNHEFETNNLT
ncbi:MAG: hypothetical protein K5644_03525 [Lachnospiraceae bacterium]|nr:hypothetical protein [Lachnospiraceae bacterium]